MRELWALADCQYKRLTPAQRDLLLRLIMSRRARLRGTQTPYTLWMSICLSGTVLRELAKITPISLQIIDVWEHSDVVDITAHIKTAAT